MVSNFVGWLLVVAAAVAALIDINLVLVLATSPIATNVVAALLVLYAVLYIALALNTLALCRLGRLPANSRVFTVVSSVVVSGLVAAALTSIASLAHEQASLISNVFSKTGLATPVDGRYNIMLVGSDSGADRIGMRTDSVSVLSLDAITGDALNIGLPRNLQKAPFSAGSPMGAIWPKGYNCGDVCLLNAINTDVMNNHQDIYPNAAADGITPGLQALKEAVQGVTGLPISNYVLIDMNGFQGLINAVGGITIDVKMRLPIGGKLDDGSDARSFIEPGQQNMSGATALWYARSRHGLNGNSDYARMARQREVENALLKQVNPMTILTHFNAVAAAGKRMVRTDISGDMLAAYVNLALKSRGSGMRTLELVPANGIDMINPDFAGIQAKIRAELHG